ncbi:hypothetical protein DB29_01770 [Shouchella clausii]|nr:hypothetical protein DB29_01770 [Shouchella clausii]
MIDSETSWLLCSWLVFLLIWANYPSYHSSKTLAFLKVGNKKRIANVSVVIYSVAKVS